MADNPTPSPEKGSPEKGPAPDNTKTDEKSGDVNKALGEIQESIAKLAASQQTLTKDVIGLRKHVKGGAEPDKSEQGKDAGGQTADPNAAALAQMDLAEAMAALPEAARGQVTKDVRAALERGEPLESVIGQVKYATQIAKVMGSAGEKPGPTNGQDGGGEKPNRPAPPPGQGETPPTDNSTGGFRTFEEWQKYRRGNPDKALDYMRKHPQFDPERLPGHPFRPTRS